MWVGAGLAFCGCRGVCCDEGRRICDEFGEHRLQYCFSIVGCAWSSFISILSVSWVVRVGCGQGEGCVLLYLWVWNVILGLRGGKRARRQGFGCLAAALVRGEWLFGEVECGGVAVGECDGEGDWLFAVGAS